MSYTDQGFETAASHTPGPWRANGLRDDPDPEWRLACAVWAGDKPICSTAFTVGKYEALPAIEQDANARLIAAAPDLLAALQAAEGAVESILDGNTNPSLQAIAAIHDMMLAAIAKATKGE